MTMPYPECISPLSTKADRHHIAIASHCRILDPAQEVLSTRAALADCNNSCSEPFVSRSAICNLPYQREGHFKLPVEAQPESGDIGIRDFVERNPLRSIHGILKPLHNVLCCIESSTGSGVFEGAVSGIEREQKLAKHGPQPNQVEPVLVDDRALCIFTLTTSNASRPKNRSNRPDGLYPCSQIIGRPGQCNRCSSNYRHHSQRNNDGSNQFVHSFLPRRSYSKSRRAAR